MSPAELDLWHMDRCLELAARGAGSVEPNPMVGAMVCRGAEIIGEGWHREFGGPHAEVLALQMAGSRARGATLYVTLEPCCHWGKTPPCTSAILAAGIRRVVVALPDPFPQVAGKGVEALASAGIEISSGVREEAARALAAPYLKLLSQGRPWVIAKWAMTLDGKLASRLGDSRWISSEASREVTHRLRGRVDAILVGAGTAIADDPALTARPPGPRTATRIVLVGRRELPIRSRLVRTARETPVIVAAPAVPNPYLDALRAAGCEVLELPGETHAARIEALVNELGSRRMTNLLVEGGAQVLGEFFDRRLIDEVHAFIAPVILGGRTAPSPLGGEGLPTLREAFELEQPRINPLAGDVYLSGRLRQRTSQFHE